MGNDMRLLIAGSLGMSIMVNTVRAWLSLLALLSLGIVTYKTLRWLRGRESDVSAAWMIDHDRRAWRQGVVQSNWDWGAWLKSKQAE